MIYYVVENKNGFEQTVFQGTCEEAEEEKTRRESYTACVNQEVPGHWLSPKYYVVPETEHTPEIGAMH
jgi:hypothetical protein